MNKKILLLIITLLMVAMIATPLVGTAQASRCWSWRKPRTVDTFTLTPFENPPTFKNKIVLVPPTEEYIYDGTIRIAWGALRKYDYSGPLGTGTFYLETILSISYGSVETVVVYPPFGPPGGGEMPATGCGGGFYKYTLEIEGDYGTGTLEGFGRLRWDWDYTESPPRYDQWDTATLYPVEGDLDITKVCVEGYVRRPPHLPPPPPKPFFGWWWTSTTVVSYD